MADRDISDMLRSNQAAKEALETLARERRNGAKPAYTDTRLMAYRLADYLYTKTEVDKKPITKTGIRMSLRLPVKTYYQYRDGDNDINATACTKDGTPLQSREGDISHIIDDYKAKTEIQPYYHYLIGSQDDDEGYTSFSQVIKNAEDFFLEQVENYTFERGNVVDIFNSKVHLGYQDETPQAPQTVNQTLIVSGDSADKALAHIGLKLIEE